MTAKLKSSGKLILAVLLLSWPAIVRADDDGQDRWHFITAPHLWAAGIDGNVTVKGIKTDVDIGFDEIRDHLQGAFMTYLELRKRKFGFYVNPMYLKLTGGDTTFDGGDADFEQQLWVVEFGGFYNILTLGEDKPMDLDLIVGGRYWNNHTDVDLSGPVIGTVSSANTDDVIDPLIGLRANQYITKRLSWSLRGDIGGFGVSDHSSDFSWQGMGMLGYDLSKRFSIWGGYRALALDKENGSGANKQGLDITLHGPILGLQARF